LVHGRNGAPGQAQIAEIAEAYLARGWRVAAPELPHSIALPNSGPSDQVTFTGHTRAAAGVWAWLAQTWPDQRRALAGHSIGAYAIAHLAGDDPGTDHILAVSPPLSGMVLLSARVAMGPDAVEAVKREAPLFHAEMPIADAAPALARSHAPLVGAGDTHHVLAMSPPMSGRVLLAARHAMGPAAIEAVKSEAPAYFAEMQIADAEPALNRIAAPLAGVTGAEDGLVRLKDARAYFNAAPNGRFFGALPNEHHCPAGKACADMLAAALVAVGA
ncbi:MAG TPA: alpha/beta hydrolase, partial [Paracoccus sp. (in: a-proteobacteria)]|nr:alpha/beta hydrolase [Paracoccus sp. (in: a-proteobacteria)]